MLHHKHLLILFIVFFLGACQNSIEPESKYVQVEKPNGDINFGGILKLNETKKIETLHPLKSASAHEQKIISLLYDRLLRLNPYTLELESGLAKNWEISNNGLDYVFHLQQGIYFHGNDTLLSSQRKKIDAKSIVHCLKKVATETDDNRVFWLIKGKFTPQDIQYVDDSTLTIHLQKPFPPLLKVLAHPGFGVYDTNATQAHLYGSGAFQFLSKNDDFLILQKNKHYWRRDSLNNKLPYLDGIRLSFEQEKEKEFIAFKKSGIDVIERLLLEDMRLFMDIGQSKKRSRKRRFNYSSQDLISLQSLDFNTQRGPFNNLKVRKAFSLAIDREKIVNKVLQGDGVVADGFVPPVLGYVSITQGFEYNPQKAQKLLAEAGFAKGNGFPEITLVVNKDAHKIHELTLAVKQMIKTNLNVDILIEKLSFEEKLKLSSSKSLKFWRTGWVADYPDAENFLSLYYGKNAHGDQVFTNATQFMNDQYDELLEEAFNEADVIKRNNLYQKAELILMDQIPSLPIYYDSYTRVYHSYIKNCPFNSMDYADYSEVYFDFE